jgi:phosphohistidine swiveling domain-containing protein
LNIENHYGFPCDIEWAYEQGKFYIVQSRPITTLSNKKGNNLPPIPNLDDYQQLFEVGGMPFLISDIWSEHYRSLQCLLLFANNTWTSFLPKTVIQKTLKEGLDILSSKDVFTKYNQDFNQYKSDSSKFFDNLISKVTVTKSDVLEFFKFASALFIFYSKTEFFYTDQAFLESKNNVVLKSNLSTMEQTKNSGREYLNKIFFGSESIYNRLLSILEKQYQIELGKLNGYSRDEVLALFDSKKVLPAIINDRLRSYVMLARDEIFLKFEGKIAESIIGKLIKPSDSHIGIIRGTCANTGKATGIATVMLFGYHDFDELHHKIAAMKQGEILIAETTSPEFMLACQKAGAIVTNQGGLLSHAAIVSRELGIPCVVGTGNATKAFKTGDLVEVDADNGIVKIIKKYESPIQALSNPNLAV